MREALAAHFKILQQQAGQEITYSNGSELVTVVAVRSRPRTSLIDAAEGVSHGSKYWEWLVNSVELGIEPRSGHFLTDADGVKYRVHPNSPNELPWRPSDGQRTFIRIFTEQQ